MNTTQIQKQLNKTIQDELQEIKQLLAVQTDEPINIDEVCQLTGFKKSYVYKLVSERKISYFKPLGKKLFFSKTEIKEWLFRNKHKSKEEIGREADKYLNNNKIKTFWNMPGNTI